MTFPDSLAADARATPRDGGVGAPLTRREARERERAAALAAEGGAVVAMPVSAPSLVAPVSAPSALAPSAAARGAAAPSITATDLAAESTEAEALVSTATLAAPMPLATAGPTTRRELRARGSRRVPAVEARRSRPAAVSTATASTSRASTARPTTSPARTAAARTRRFGVLGGILLVGATIVSTSVPANAYFVDTPANVAVKLAVAAEAGTTVGGAVSTAKSQAYVASGTVVDPGVGRDGYSVSVEQASGSGSFTNDSSAAVQWPFATTSPISSGFGARQVSNCSFCSTFHQGLDFTPGAGTPIQIIADGTVSKVEQGGGALGYNVWIDHVIGGRTITSVYAHMLAGSIKVAVGQRVKVGQQVGNVGSTGNSTGAHLHFEIHIDGVPVDPYPWLVANAG